MAEEPTVLPMNPELDPMVETDDSFPPLETPEPAPPEEPEGEPEPPAEPEPAPEPEPDKPDGVQRRINKAVRKQREAERREAAAVAREKELQEKLDGLTTKEPPSQDAPSTKAPDEDDFTSIDDYHRAYADWRAAESTKETQRVIREELEKDRKTRADQDAQQKVDAQYETFTKKGTEKYDDFQEVALSGEMYDEGGVMLNAVLNAENGADIAYYLGQYADVAEEVYQKAVSNPVTAVFQLGQIGAELAAKQPSTHPSSAPEPVPSLKGSDAGPTPDPNKEPIGDFMKRKREEQRKALRLKS